MLVDEAEAEAEAEAQTHAPKRVRSDGRGTFGFIYQQPMRQLGRDVDSPLHTDARLLMVVVGRANNSGHAMFDPGELQTMLGNVDPQTGAIQPLHRTSVAKAVKRGIDAGAYAFPSSPRCVVLPHHIWTKRYRGTPLCTVHKTRAPFRNDGWDAEPEPDPTP